MTASPSIQLLEGGDGRLLVWQGDERIAVTPKLCFPWSHRNEYISLRREPSGDDDKKAFEEVALIQSLDDLDGESRAILERHLATAGFLLRISKINSFRKEFELRVWDVETEQGPRKFQTKLDYFPTQLPGGALLIKDVAGDLMFIPNPDELDAASAEKLWAFSD